MPYITLEKLKQKRELFFSKIDYGDFSRCWNWKAGFNSNGYGEFWNGFRSMPAHRYSFETFRGRVDDGLVLDHLCKNKNCVNPNHLEAVTTKENNIRGDGFAGVNSRKTHCIRGHKLIKKNLCGTYLKKGIRKCKICHNMKANMRRWIKESGEQIC